jgi:hypothetical protein
MNVRCLLVVVLLGFAAASCSRKPPAELSKKDAETQRRETDEEREPKEDKIGEDCVAFVAATKIVPAQQDSADCPGCRADGAQVLVFREMHVDQVSCSDMACDVAVTLRVGFNPAPAGTINGGLTAWIPEQQKADYQRGQTPQGEQVYRVKIIYKRAGDAWRAIEFDRADSP